MHIFLSSILLFYSLISFFHFEPCGMLHTLVRWILSGMVIFYLIVLSIIILVCCRKWLYKLKSNYKIKYIVYYHLCWKRWNLPFTRPTILCCIIPMKFSICTIVAWCLIKLTSIFSICTVILRVPLTQIQCSFITIHNKTIRLIFNIRANLTSATLFSCVINASICIIASRLILYRTTIQLS